MLITKEKKQTRDHKLDSIVVLIKTEEKEEIIEFSDSFLFFDSRDPFYQIEKCEDKLRKHLSSIETFNFSVKTITKTTKIQPVFLVEERYNYKFLNLIKFYESFEYWTT